MNATKLKGRVTRDHRLIVELPSGISAGTVEVILLQTPSKPRKSTRRASAHPAFGIWADRSEIEDSAAFAENLRRRVEMRVDGRQ